MSTVVMTLLINIPNSEQEFCYTFNDFFLTQLNHIPSSDNCNDILELVFISLPDRITNMCISHEGFLTDHRLLEFDVFSSVRKN